MNTYPKTHTILSSKAYTNWKIYLSSTAPVWNSEIKSQTQMMNFELLMMKISLISEKTFVFLCIYDPFKKKLTDRIWKSCEVNQKILLSLKYIKTNL